MILRNVLAAAVVVASVGLASGCKGSSSDSGSECGAVVSALRNCGLVSEGTVRCGVYDDFNECEVQCLSNCANTERALCEGESDAIMNCFEACEANEPDEPDFHCASGHTVPASWQCDGENDCGDGSDEEGCAPIATFSCGDGEEIPEGWQCDGETDCSNGADEANCAGRLHRCSDGEMIPMDWVCDLEEDCIDGSDESPAQGCASLLCGN